ncbi:MAG TPA: PAAR domain-containing protein [Acidobacteriaceae bacterium]|nr:PAAR domain-containing protein [Acidobacteriaceae bacterium]
MGMPACTITSMTAHGGVVVVGFPTVLIGGMPASRIGDMHVCPMVTVLVPHVGGPFILGSPTVIVGGMPQSRVTDMLVCVGPPDVAVMGCPTVLVGMAGCGGMMGAVEGIKAMAVPVLMAAASSAASTLQSELQQDGTMKTSAALGSRLPPITLKQAGWPDLPAKATPNFQSVQPVTLPANTTLFQTVDSSSGSPGSFWSPNPPAGNNAGPSPAASNPDWNDGGKVTSATVPHQGTKAWMGPASSQGSLPGGAPQVYLPPGTVGSSPQVKG